MNDLPHDFGTGLRAHLGLEEAELELVPAPEPEPEEELEPAAEATPVLEEPGGRDGAPLEALVAFEEELLERERALVEREASFAGRAGALLAAAQALYDEVLSGRNPLTDDELARMRRRKSVA